jgi:hypothetical protein
MTIPGMDLQTQYDQTLQNTIGKSQRDRLQDIRKQQTLANTDWSQRGVGQDAHRFAGFQEVNPSSMPNMSDETRSFIKPLLGTYQEGGRDVEGYYGKDNPYTQTGLESLLSQQGYARAPSSIEDQFKSVGLKLPNAYGQNYYNAKLEGIGNEISKYKQQEQIQRQQADPWYKYTSQGFVPGQDVQLGNGDYWRWQAGAPQYTGLLINNERIDPEKDQNYLDSLNNYNMGLLTEKPVARQLTQDEQTANDVFDYYNAKYPEGSGIWFYNKGGKEFGDQGLEYSPTTGYSMQTYDSPAKGFNKFMPALTMASLGAMFGGAGYASMGGATGGAGALSGQAIGAAIPTTMQTGLTTGDWGKALESGGISALSGGLAGAYGGDLANALGMGGKVGEGLAKGLISSAVNTTGNALLGNKIDTKNILANTISNIAAPYLGELTKNAIGGTGGDILGGAIGGFSGNALKNILTGKSLDIGTALDTFAGATGGLGKLFSNTNEDKQSVTGPTKLADTIQGMKNAPTKNWRT